jgi:hypothetical protein
MTSRGQDGYVLAGALAVLLTMSLVATALVSSTSDGLKRVRAAEIDAQTELTLKSAIAAAGAQLAADPRRRSMTFENGSETIVVGDASVDVAVSWEALRLDLNRASPDEIAKLLDDVDVDDATRGRIRSAIEAARTRDEVFQLTDEVISLAEAKDAPCLEDRLTIFGGSDAYTPSDEAPALIGRPAAGARIRLKARLQTSSDAPGITAVVLMTGAADAPFKVLDYRPLRVLGGEVCRDTDA